jgi:methyl-accepting chemotaxis protein
MSVSPHVNVVFDRATFLDCVHYIILMTAINPARTMETQPSPKTATTAIDAVERIKQISKRLRDYSIAIRETTIILRESGAIPELAEAVRQVSFAVRDTAKEIHRTTAELNEGGVIRDIAHTIEETHQAVRDTAQAARTMVSSAKEATPQIPKLVQAGVEA